MPAAPVSEQFAPHAPSEASAPVAETTLGAVRGRHVADGAVAVWRGVPYAAPPVGALRFAAPQPPAAWTGVRDAAAPGRSAVQPPPQMPAALQRRLGARRSRSEDCLTLNVWAPAGAAADRRSGTADAARRDGTLRPVVVWIHGGSFNTGAGSLYDCAQLVADGDVVVVAINYRLGGLGFINFHDAVGGDERIVTNPGVRDQLAALRWVHANIEAFGGDPARVTIAGESAGSCGVSLLLAAPEARGLFHGAIAQSGALTLAVDRDDAARTARHVLDELGVSRERVDALWRLPASALLAATMRVQARRSGSLATRPWWDGELLPASIEEAYAGLAPIPLLIGTNAHEHRTFTRMRIDVMPLSRAALATVLTESLGWDHAARILAEYPDDPDGLNDLGSDLIFQMPSTHLAERQASHAPVWKYRFDDGVGLLGLGAAHAVELSALFPSVPLLQYLGRGRLTPARAALDERFRTSWLRFVQGAGPGEDWPRFEVDEHDRDAGGRAPGRPRATRIWDLTDRVEHDPGAARRLAWAGRDVRIH